MGPACSQESLLSVKLKGSCFVAPEVSLSRMFANRSKPEREGGEGAFPPLLVHLPSEALVPATKSLPFTQDLKGSGQGCRHHHGDRVGTFRRR